MQSMTKHATIAEIIGRDASEVTKRKPVKFKEKLRTTWNPHIGLSYHVEVLSKVFK